MKNISRRDFLKVTTNSLLALSSLLGLGGLIRFLGYNADPTPPTEYDVGPLTSYSMGSHTVLAYIPAIVIHDQKGLRAISLACTHLGCTVEESNFGFTCPCHGSRYDQDGVVQKGPAKLNLKKLRIEQTEDGNLHIFTT